MTSSLPSAVGPLAILQAEYMAKKKKINLKKAAASLHAMKNDAESNLLPQWFTEILSMFPI